MWLHGALALARKVAEGRATYTQKTADAIACVTFSGLTNCCELQAEAASAVEEINVSGKTQDRRSRRA